MLREILRCLRWQMEHNNKFPLIFSLAALDSVLATHFQSCTADEWLTRHNAVSEENFSKEPHRNKLNVVLSRTNHLANHLGQMLLLK